MLPLGLAAFDGGQDRLQQLVRIVRKSVVAPQGREVGLGPLGAFGCLASHDIDRSKEQASVLEDRNWRTVLFPIAGKY